jgi:hypothetical protein
MSVDRVDEKSGLAFLRNRDQLSGILPLARLGADAGLGTQHDLYIADVDLGLGGRGFPRLRMEVESQPASNTFVVGCSSAEVRSLS